MTEDTLANAKSEATQALEEAKFRAAAIGKLKALITSDEWQMYEALAHNWIRDQRSHILDQTRVNDKTRAHMTDDWLRGTIGGASAMLKLPLLEVKAFDEEQEVASKEASGAKARVQEEARRKKEGEQMGLRDSPLPPKQEKVNG